MVFKYIKSQQFKTIQALKNAKKNIAMLIKAKKTLIKKSAFLKLLKH